MRLFLPLFFFIATSAQAALIDRGEGFIYDDVLDITWTQNANINDNDIWNEQRDWADIFYSQTHSVYGTFDDWELTSMDVNGDGTIVNCASASAADCQDNQLGYMLYQNGVSSGTPGLFTNIQGRYWSNTGGNIETEEGSESGAWYFDFRFGGQQGLALVDDQNYAWAVRAGDVAAVPVPAAVWLFASALAGLGWFRRKQTV